MTSSEDIPAVVCNQLTGLSNATTAEFMLVSYVFDFSMARHELAGARYVEVGRNDLDMPLVLSESQGQLFIIADGEAAFINSSLPQFLAMIRAFQEAAKAWSDDTPDDRRLKEFDTLVATIDPEAVHGPESFWSQVREEMEHGLI